MAVICFNFFHTYPVLSVYDNIMCSKSFADGFYSKWKKISIHNQENFEQNLSKASNVILLIAEILT
jgi:hypothetical protein